MPEPISTTVAGLYAAHRAFHQAHPHICRAMDSLSRSAVKSALRDTANRLDSWCSSSAERREMTKLSDRLNSQYCSGSRTPLIRHRAFDQF